MQVRLRERKMRSYGESGIALLRCAEREEGQQQQECGEAECLNEEAAVGAIATIWGPALMVA
jgi:hypothetical protein